MNDLALPLHDSAIQALSSTIGDASDRQVMRIVAMVDALNTRGAADQLIVPLRRQLRTLRVPRPLRFKRLLFAPLDQLIAPMERWALDQNTIPRTALTPMAELVRDRMAREAEAIAAAIAGKTTADIDLISRLGRSLWPQAARVLAEAKIPPHWAATGIEARVYRPLADIVVALLEQAWPLDVLCSEAAHRLLPPRPEAIALLVSKTAVSSSAALPMLIAVMLLRLPQAAAAIRGAYFGPQAATVRAALEQAADHLLQQLADEKTTEARIAFGTLIDAGGAVVRITTLLDQFRNDTGRPKRREQMRRVRQSLDAACKKRFMAAMQNEFLAPLRRLGSAPTAADLLALEGAARGLRVLEIEARAVGSASTYDLLMGKAVEAVTTDTMRDRLTLVEQIRLVEILAGPDAALALMEDSGARVRRLT